jgi:hypothetical protein
MDTSPTGGPDKGAVRNAARNHRKNAAAAAIHPLPGFSDWTFGIPDCSKGGRREKQAKYMAGGIYDVVGADTIQAKRRIRDSYESAAASAGTTSAGNGRRRRRTKHPRGPECVAAGLRRTDDRALRRRLSPRRKARRSRWPGSSTYALSSASRFRRCCDSAVGEMQAWPNARRSRNCAGASRGRAEHDPVSRSACHPACASSRPYSDSSASCSLRIASISGRSAIPARSKATQMLISCLDM